MAKNNLIGGSIWDEYSKVVQDRMNNPKFMGEITEEDAKKANAKLIVADFGARRAHNVDAAVYGARAAYIGGVQSTATVLACLLYTSFNNYYNYNN